MLLNESYQKAILKFAQDPTKATDEYVSCGETLNGIFTQISNIEALSERLETTYSFLGLQKAADLMQIKSAALNDRILPCRLWMFWCREMFRVCEHFLCFLNFGFLQKRLERGTKILMKRCKTIQHIELITEKAIVLGQVSLFWVERRLAVSF